MATLPVIDIIVWALTAVSPDVEEPTLSRQNTGIVKVAGIPEKPLYEEYNFLFKSIAIWLAYSRDSIAEDPIYATSGDFYSEGVGSAPDVYVLEVVAPIKAITALRDGQLIRFKVVNPNTGISTIDIAGTGIKTIKLNGDDLILGNLLLDEYVDLTYNLANDVYELSYPFLRPVVIPSLPSRYFSGFNLSNGVDAEHDINIGPGACRDSTDTIDIISTITLTKQIDATWADGNNTGGLAAGVTLAINTWYHFIELVKETGETNAGYDTSINATNLLADAAVISAGYTKFKWIGAAKTDGASNILPGTWQDNSNDFRFDTTILDFTTNGDSTNIINLSVPLGIRSKASILGRVTGFGGGYGFIFVRDLLTSSEYELTGHVDSASASASYDNSTIWSNTSSQIEFRYNEGANSTTASLITKGYFINRGEV